MTKFTKHLVTKRFSGMSSMVFLLVEAVLSIVNDCIKISLKNENKKTDWYDLQDQPKMKGSILYHSENKAKHF